MTKPDATHRIPFAGDGGEYPLSWAQESIWQTSDALRPDHGQLNVPLAVEIDRAVDIPYVLQGVRTLVERHEALRTTFVTTAAGERRQAVAAQGELAVDVYESSAAAIDDLRETLTQAQIAVGFEDDDLPVRASVLSQDGNPRWLVLVLSHLAVDGWGSGVIYDDLRRYLVRGTMPGDPDRTLPPRAQAAYEGSQHGSRRAQRSLRHIREQLARFPNMTFPTRKSAAESPRYHQVSVTSMTIADAMHRLARKHSVSPSAVLVAGYSLVLARASGRRRLGYVLASANRVTSDEHTAASTYFQNVPVCVEVPDGSFRELLQRTMTSLALAYRNGRYPPGEYTRAVLETYRERGATVDLSCSINLHMQVQGQFREDDSILPEQSQVFTADSGDLVDWRDSRSQSLNTLGLSVWSLTDTVHFTIWTDTAVISRKRTEAIIEGLERVLVRAVDAAVDATVQAITSSARVPELDRNAIDVDDVNGLWVDREEVRGTLQEALATDAVGVFVVPLEGGGVSLEAYLGPAEVDAELDILRERFLQHVGRRLFVAAPHRLTVCASVPTDTNSLVEWQAQEALWSGTLWEPHGHQEGDSAEVRLVDES